MKKIITVLFLMMFILSGCSDNQNADPAEEPADEATKRIADDTSILSMNITAPADYVSCSRYSEYDKDNKLIEKDIVFKLSDTELITYSVATDSNVAELTDPAKLDTRESNGEKYYLYKSDKLMLGMCEKGSDLMIVEMEFDGDVDEERFFEVLDSVTYSDKSETITDDPLLEGLIYAGDDSRVKSYGVTVEEDREGNMTEKNVIRYYGSNPDDYDFRIVTRMVNNSAISELVKPEYEAEEITVNGITYQAYNVADEAEAYDYFYESGGKVYEIRNAGRSGFLSTTRSEESFAAFHEFVDKVSFE